MGQLAVGQLAVGQLAVGQLMWVSWLWGSWLWVRSGCGSADVGQLAVGRRQARARVVTGAELAAMSPAALEAALRAHPEMVFARTSPQQKLVIVESCQKLVRNRGGEMGEMGGDGVRHRDT